MPTLNALDAIFDCVEDGFNRICVCGDIRIILLGGGGNGADFLGCELEDIQSAG